MAVTGAVNIQLSTPGQFHLKFHTLLMLSMIMLFTMSHRKMSASLNIFRFVFSQLVYGLNRRVSVKIEDS